MIVITSFVETTRVVTDGDEFQLRISDKTGSEMFIRETITESKVLDYIASYRFALDDGTVVGFHLSGVFANKAELPKELQEAVFIEDLSREQYENFVRTCGIERPAREPLRMFKKWHEQERKA